MADFCKFFQFWEVCSPPAPCLLRLCFDRFKWKRKAKTETFHSFFIRKRSSMRRGLRGRNFCKLGKTRNFGISKVPIQPACFPGAISWLAFVVAIFMARENGDSKGQARGDTCKVRWLNKSLQLSRIGRIGTLLGRELGLHQGFQYIKCSLTRQ